MSLELDVVLCYMKHKYLYKKNMEKTNVMLIICSVRPNRLGEKIAMWANGIMENDPSLDIDLVDLKNFDLPFYNEPISPLWMKKLGKEYQNPKGREWADRVGDANKFVVVTPEYNHHAPASLISAIEWVGPEWEGKNMLFISYSVGEGGGKLAVQSMTPIMEELKIVKSGELNITNLGSIYKDGPVDNVEFDRILDTYSESLKHELSNF